MWQNLVYLLLFLSVNLTVLNKKLNIPQGFSYYILKNTEIFFQVPR